MKFLLKTLLIVTFLSMTFSAAFAEDGRSIMEKQKKMQSTKNEYSYEQMVLVDSSGGKEARTLTRNTKEVGDDKHKVLLVFLTPADIKGTALLTWEQKDRDDDQWLFMPDLGKMQRIAKGSKKNYFMGTDFTYEDMSSENLDNFKYTIIREEKIKDADVWVIEAVPVDSYKKKSSYSKRILWIRKDMYVSAKIEFYGRKGELIKTQVADKFQHLGGTVYRAGVTLMNNKKENHKTFVKTIKIDIKNDIDEGIFSERYILKGLHTQVK